MKKMKQQRNNESRHSTEGGTRMKSGQVRSKTAKRHGHPNRSTSAEVRGTERIPDDSQSNIEVLFADCFEERRLDFQRRFGREERLALHHLVENGAVALIKTAFEDAETREHMWVRVLAVNTGKGTLTGVLWSVPHSIQTVRYGNTVEVGLNSIESLRIGCCRIEGMSRAEKAGGGKLPVAHAKKATESKKKLVKREYNVSAIIKGLA